MNEADFQIGSRFTKLTVVNIISNIIVPLVGLVDLAFLGHLTDIRYLAGVAIAVILFDYLYRTCKFLRMATTGSTAQAVGRSDNEAVLLILLRNGLVALIVAAIILLLHYPIRELGFTLLSAAPEVKAAARDYYNTRIWAAPAALSNLVLLGWFLGQSQSNKVLALSIISNGTNIVLDYLFIVQWGWNSAGAGAATAISQYVMLVLALIMIAGDGYLPKLPAVAGQILDPVALKATFQMNFDVLIRSLGTITTFAIFASLSGFLGTVVLAGNSLMVEVVNLAVFLIEGSAFATETLAGNFHGEGCHEKLLPLLRLSGVTSLSLGLALALVFISFPEKMFGLLTNHLEVIDQINDYVLWLLPVLVMVGFVYMLEGYFLGLTQMFVLRNGILAAFFIGFVPLVIAAWQFENIHLLWLGLLVFMVIRAITLALYVPSTLKPDEGLELNLSTRVG